MTDAAGPLSGPLTGVRIVELAGIGPGPFCGMLLSDLGADVVRIDRVGGRGGAKTDITSRGRRSLALDLKDPAAIETCLQLIEKADAVFEGLDGARKSGVTVVLIEQFVHRALGLADRCVILTRGRVGWSGPAAEAHQEVIDRYLGEVSHSA